MQRVKKAREFIRRTSAVKKETGIKRYSDLVSVQEIIREVGRLLDQFSMLAPVMQSFTIDTPRHSFTIIWRERKQRTSTLVEKPMKSKGRR